MLGALLRVGLLQLQAMRVPDHAAVSATVDAVSVATIQRLGTGLLPQGDPDRLAHTFRFGQDVSQQRYFNSGSASGLGDITIRLKGTAT